MLSKLPNEAGKPERMVKTSFRWKKKGRQSDEGHPIRREAHGDRSVYVKLKLLRQKSNIKHCGTAVAERIPWRLVVK